MVGRAWGVLMVAGCVAVVGSTSADGIAMSGISTLSGIPEAKAQAGQAAMEPADLVEAVRRFNPNVRAFFAERDDATEQAKAKLAEFRATMDRVITPSFVAEANDPANRVSKRAKQRAERWAEQARQRILQADLTFAEERGRGGVLRGQYAELLFQGEGLRQLSRAFPSSAIIADAVAATEERVGQLGSFTDIEQRAVASELAVAAKRRLRPAAKSDPALARQFQRAFRSSIWTKNYADAQFVKTNLIERGWTVERNPVTGIILSRYQRAHFGLRKPDGSCHSYLVIFEQKHSGGGRYGPIYMQSGQDQLMLCENI